MEPYLVFRRTGRTIAMVLAFGFGGGTVLLGVGTAAGAAFSVGTVFSAATGYILASLPFFVGALILMFCRRELWIVPDDKMLRMLTFRPWLWRGPRIEQAPLDEYRGLCLVSLDHRAERSSLAVALITEDGDRVPIREFDVRDQADDYVRELADITGLPRIAGEQAS